ncbi:MAG TPA: protein-disulfide reductase DsbD domain-containing protein [Acidobacteriaceae bacterium]|jgi:thiol:disulfide interchange protein DsbD|nr:protein-disulfide reductase DsbD domain-containing protein [Acidobacteriaceae bacterium]
MTKAVALLVLAVSGAVARGQLVEVGDGGPGPVKAEHLTAELTSLSPQIAPGGKQTIGLVLTIEEHWHVYWINAGDSGEPPAIKWTLPKGLKAGPLQFPPPQRLPLGPLMDYGYEDQVGFPIQLSAEPGVKPGKAHLDAHVSWLVCAQVCLPGKAHLGMDMNVVHGPLPETPVVGALGQAINSLPKMLPAGMTASAVGGPKRIAITIHTGSTEEDAEFYPYEQQVIENAADQEVQSLPDGVRVTVQRASDSTSLPKTVHGLIKLSGSESYEFTAPVTAGAVPDAAGPAAKVAKAATPSDVTAFGAMGLAFLGGLILNLMPCVFLVLFLKGLALVNSSGEERHRQRLHGVVYTLGIMVSFWAIVAALLGLRAGGRELGWGFQLQSPGFVAVLASLMFFLALSLAGQFELGLSLTSAGGGLAQKQGFTGSFFTGVLATVVATPCMGPLMGAAVGFALAQPAWLTFVVFTALALGLALPYLVLSMQPQWTRVLPKPGAWMETLKQLTALPLFATALWLAWVYAHLYSSEGVDRMTRLLACFLVLAVAGWVLGRWPARWGSAVGAVVLMVAALSLPLRRPKPETMAWQPFTPASFEAARASGKPVFVDFTADWCLSCKFNEAAVLRSAEVESKLRTDGVQLLKADWTKYDPEITKRLAAVERSGVPTYVIYPPGQNSNADVLPELLTKDIVLKALEKDAKS